MPYTHKPAPYILKPQIPDPTPKTLILNLTRKSIYDKCSCATKITTHLDHIRHCKTTPGTNWLTRWAYRVFIINTHRDQIPKKQRPPPGHPRAACRALRHHIPRRAREPSVPRRVGLLSVPKRAGIPIPRRARRRVPRRA